MWGPHGGLWRSPGVQVAGRGPVSSRNMSLSAVCSKSPLARASSDGVIRRRTGREVVVETAFWATRMAVFRPSANIDFRARTLERPTRAEEPRF